MAISETFAADLSKIFATFPEIEEVYVIPTSRNLSGEDIAVLSAKNAEETLEKLICAIKKEHFAVPLRIQDVNDVSEDLLDSMESIYEKGRA
ncbi:hypothetical protein COW46_03145 [Candidatus Gracilibacteria bacterium CG17_big_fil_post_rev_8_21_14_2_50_48_13]|nr:MAG: hypothetical protein COW46_03145 [Candidatus Gracilibacteria bacterium CG17_big_fil_post_rev_8_21_14_2_50_48_13]